MQISKFTLISSAVAAVLIVCTIMFAVGQSEARSIMKSKPSNLENDYDQAEAASAVIPSPNQLFGDEQSVSVEIQRKQQPADVQQLATQASTIRESSPVAAVPVYSSHYVVPESFASNQESSHKSANFASPSTSADEQEPSREDELSSNHHPRSTPKADLKVAESYGHGHHGSHHGHHDEHYDSHHHHSKGHDHSGWLDMGAYTGKKGAFGWHAKYPVGSKKHGHYRK